MSASNQGIKCVVWDLDNTLWKGALLEGQPCELDSGINALIERLDERGVLQSVASRGDESLALEKLAAEGLSDVLLHPQIGWNDKSASIARIAHLLNIDPASIVFVDDDPFERAEVMAALPQVRCLSPDDVAGLHTISSRPLADFSLEARNRRHTYQAEALRAHEEARYAGNPEAFRESIGMQVRVRAAVSQDIARLSELLERTTQLNTSGRFYSIAELESFTRTQQQHLLVLEYQDQYGDLGTVGLAILDKTDRNWTLKVALVSCRVMSRGMGMVFLAIIAEMARRAGAVLYAEYVRTNRNRPMALALALSGFAKVEGSSEDVTLLERDGSAPIEIPSYVTYAIDAQ